MLIKVSFERWLQQFNSRLNIRSLKTRYIDKKNGKEFIQENVDIDVLYLGNQRLVSIPKGLKTAKGWSNLNDMRGDQGYETLDGIPHRSLSGIGLVLLGRKIISPRQFVRHFQSARTKAILENKYKMKFKSGY